MRRGATPLLLLGIVALATIAAAVLLAAKPTPADSQSVQAAARDAMLDIIIPFRFAKTDVENGKVKPSVDVAAKQTALAANLDSHMTGDARSSWARDLRDALDRQVAGGHSIDLDGGITELTFMNVVINGATATVDGSVKTWNDVINPDTLVVNRNTGDYEFRVHLALGGGKWRADDVSLRPAGFPESSDPPS